MACCKFMDYAKVIDRKAWSQKRVTKVDTDDKSVSLILGLIDFINSLDEDEYAIWGNHPIEDILVPNEFKDFVLPSSVRYDALNRRTVDQLDKPQDVTNPCQTYSQYVEACDKFRARFKKDGYSDMTPIGSLRKAVNFNDVVSRASIGGKVCASATPFIPIPLIDNTLFGERYFNESLNDIIEDYIADMRFI